MFYPFNCYQQHATVSASKLKAKEIDLQKKRNQLISMKKRVKQLESTQDTNISGTVELPDGTILQGEETIRHLESCKEILKQHEARKQHISSLHYESLVLDRTVTVLQGRHGNIEEFLKQQEEKAGVKGFHETQERLQHAEREKEEVDQMKGETLQEISDMVTEMTDILKREREKLQPMVSQKELFLFLCIAIEN